jgi:hypothetical protein
MLALLWNGFPELGPDKILKLSNNDATHRGRLKQNFEKWFQSGILT